MKTIRQKVFETNSSSTHSVTYYSKSEDGKTLFPRNEQNYNITKNITLPYNTIVKSEKEKIRYILALFAGNISELGIEYTYNCKNNLSSEEFELECTQILELPAIKAYIKVLKDLFNTDIFLDFDNQQEFPYFSEGVGAEDTYLRDIIMNVDFMDETSVYKFLKECISNPECLFIDDDSDW